MKDEPRQHVVMNATTRQRTYVLAWSKPRRITLPNGTPLRRVAVGVYEAADGTRYGAESDDAP